MASSRILRRVALVRTDVSEELSASFIRVTTIGELGTTLPVTSNRRTLRRNTKSKWDFMSQKKTFFIVTAVKISNPTCMEFRTLQINIKQSYLIILMRRLTCFKSKLKAKL
jgi:hypothetical protein